MWGIKLVDIAGDGLEVDFRTTVDSLPEVELVAVNLIKKQLNTPDIHLSHHEDLIYSVYNNEDEIGVVAIRSL